VSGLFLSFEGGEAAGKSVQAAELAESLGVRGRGVVLTREPGGTPFAERILDVLLHARDVDLAPETQALLFSAARAQHTRDVIRPALGEG
jgi:dTMP kinase